MCGFKPAWCFFSQHQPGTIFSSGLTQFVSGPGTVHEQWSGPRRESPPVFLFVSFSHHCFPELCKLFPVEEECFAEWDACFRSQVSDVRSCGSHRILLLVSGTELLSVIWRWQVAQREFIRAPLSLSLSLWIAICCSSEPDSTAKPKQRAERRSQGGLESGDN